MDDDFYARIPPLTRFIELANRQAYHDVPRPWFVVVTDVIGSTKAIEAGRYKDVNIVGAASIVAVINSVPSPNLPYVFGGDGATLLVGPSDIEAARLALARLATASKAYFDLDLRVGVVPVADLLDRGYDLQVSKLALSDSKSLAMLWGTAVKAAEELVKSPRTAATYAVQPATDGSRPELDGLSCRWQPLSSRQGHMLSVIAVARPQNLEEAGRIYRDMVAFLEEVMPMGTPIHESTAHMGNDPRALDIEATLRTQSLTGLRRFVVRRFIQFETWVARYLLRTRRSFGGFDGRRYKDTLIRHTDFRKFDGAVRMVLDVTDEQARRIENYLAQAYGRGEIFYGVHRSGQALMTCVVRDREDDHIHFIDGADGGYALAAKGLKDQIKQAAA